MSHTSFSLSLSSCSLLLLSGPLSIKPVNQLVPQAVFWFLFISRQFNLLNIPSTASLSVSGDPLEYNLMPKLTCQEVSHQVAQRQVVLTDISWLTHFNSDISQQTLISQMARELVTGDRRKTQRHSLSPTSTPSQGLIFNLALLVKMSIQHQGDVTSSRAWGGQLWFDDPSTNWFWFSSKSVKVFSFNVSWSESHSEHDRPLRVGQGMGDKPCHSRDQCLSTVVTHIHTRICTLRPSLWTPQKLLIQAVANVNFPWSSPTF